MTLGQQTAGKDLKVRYLYLGGLMLFGLLVLAVRLYRLQVTRGDEFAAKSVENFVKEVRIPADRGLILDANRRILVDSRPSFDVFITPAFCVRCADEVLPKLATTLGWDGAQRQEVERLVTRARRDAPFRPVPVRIDVTREAADFLDARRLELPGVDVQATPHRNYRTGTVLSHAIGYMNEITQAELERLNASTGGYQLGDYVGRRGVEKAFERFLRGQDGHRKRVVDARGQPIPGLSDLVGGGDAVAPVAGNNVVLSVDMRLQEEADRVFPGTAGAVIAIDVRTGFILTLLSRPGYDPNLLTGRITGPQMAELSKDPLKPMMNRCTAMHYSPGSTFKVVTQLAALREGVFTPHTAVNCPGGYRLGRRTWRCHRESGHGLRDAHTAMQASCDTYYWRAADLMGIDPIARAARDLGLGAPTGIGVLLEEPGIVPDTAYHDKVTPGGYTRGLALNTAIGQGDVNVTPLQLLMVFSTIANGGKLWRPQLVQHIESPEGQVLQRFEPELVRNVEMRPQDRMVIVESLKAVVNQPGGTAYSKRLKDVVVAGKTGTAQVARLGEKRLKTDQMDYWLRDHAWFAAFAPADDPEIAVVVLNEHGGHGGSDAAPTAMALLQKYFDLKKEDQAAGVAKDRPRENAPLPVSPSPKPAVVEAVVEAPRPPSPSPSPDPVPVIAKPLAPPAMDVKPASAGPDGPRAAPSPKTVTAVPKPVAAPVVPAPEPAVSEPGPDVAEKVAAPVQARTPAVKAAVAEPGPGAAKKAAEPVQPGTPAVTPADAEPGPDAVELAEEAPSAQPPAPSPRPAAQKRPSSTGDEEAAGEAKPPAAKAPAITPTVEAAEPGPGAEEAP